MAAIIANLTVEMGGISYVRRHFRLYEFVTRLRWALQDAGLPGARFYPLVDQLPGFLLTPICPASGGPDYCKVAHYDYPTDCRPFVARYHAALERAGFRCEWEPIHELDGAQQVAFRVYPPPEDAAQ